MVLEVSNAALEWGFLPTHPHVQQPAKYWEDNLNFLISQFRLLLRAPYWITPNQSAII
jgi:hypothetical protein